MTLDPRFLPGARAAAGWRGPRPRLELTRLVGLVLLASLLHAGGAAAAAERASWLPAMEVPGPADSLLVVAPHPDDESLCCAGIIQRAVRAGARVAVVWVTSGDGFELDAVVVEHTLRPRGTKLLQLAEMRMREGDCAAERLGIPRERRYFLGYPDRGTRALLGDHFARPFRSPYTGATRVPYPQALAPGSSYEGRNLERDLERVLDATQPTMVLAPSTEDRHPDHAAVGTLVQRVLGARDAGDRVFSWIVHAGGRWPAPRGDHPGLALTPPFALRALDWRRFPLSMEERAVKRLALGCHRSQMRVMRGVMLSFDREDEIFAAPARRQAAPAAEREAEAEAEAASAAPDTGFHQHRAHQFVQAIRIRRDRRPRFAASHVERRADLLEAMLDPLIHHELLGEKRADAGGDLGIERPRIGARNFHPGELGRTAGLQMLPPETSEFQDL